MKVRKTLFGWLVTLRWCLGAIRAAMPYGIVPLVCWTKVLFRQFGHIQYLVDEAAQTGKPIDSSVLDKKLAQAYLEEIGILVGGNHGR